MLRQSRTLPFSLAVASLLFGCGGGGGDGGTPAPSTAVAKISGDAQSGTVGQPLGDSLVVEVTEGGTPSAGMTVTWSTSGGGSVDPTSVSTDANGQAGTQWVLGTTSGNQAAQATVSGASGSPASFSAAAVPDAAVTMSKAGGDNQSGQVNAALAAQVQAKVSDQFGNGVPGVDVNWNAVGASVSAAVIPTNNAGVSPVTVTLGPNEGAVTITAESGALSGSPLSFNATATAAPPPNTTISVINNSFTPSTLTVSVGTTVTWSWIASARAHNVVPDATEPLTSGGLADGPHTYQYTFNNAGTFRYFCSNHGARGGIGMSGTITVQ
jgi:plastocyanin